MCRVAAVGQGGSASGRKTIRHVRRAQQPPAGRFPLDPRRRPADGRDGRGGAPGDPAGAARGRRQLQGRQGVHRSGARSRARSGSPSQPDAGAAGRQDRPRRDAGALRRAKGGLQPTDRAPARHADARPAGLGQDDDDRQARAMADASRDAPAAGLDRRAASRGHRAAERARTSRRRCACTIRRASWIRWRARSGALAEARNVGFDVVIVDTAGRLHIDDDADGRARGDQGRRRARRICSTSPTR